MSSTSPTCSACGTALTGIGATAYCPSCMWAGLIGSDEDVPASSPDCLFQVDGFAVRAEIARGGSAVVYLAQQLEPSREVALKMLHPHQVGSEEMLARFRLETALVAGLHHPAILPIYGAGEYRGLPYFVMKLARGGSLASRRREREMDWQSVASLLAEVAEAVHHAHTHGVIHRDLKPGNVLFDEGGRVYVADFGLARLVHADNRVTLMEGTYGTPVYLAPEVVTGGTGSATTATDVYGLGGLLYEMLVGQPPFGGPSLPELCRKISDEMPPAPRRLRPEVPRDLEAIALRCLAKDPSQRPGTAREVAEDLERWKAGRPVLAREISTFERLLHWSRRNPALAVMSVLLTCGVAAGSAIVLKQNASLRHSTARALQAERAARVQLQSALISEARSQRESGQVGARSAALARLDEAGKLGPSLSLKSEYITALSRPDFFLVGRLSTPRSRSDDTVDLSPDLTHLLDTDAGPGFVERETATGRVLHRYAGCSAPVWYLAYEARGSLISAQYRDGTVEIWERGGQRPFWAFAGTDGPPAHFAVHPSSSELVMAVSERSLQRILLVSGRTGPLSVDGAAVRWLSFNPQGDSLAIVRDNRVEVRSWPEGELLWTRSGPMSPTRPAWSREGRRLAVGLLDREEIAVLDGRTGAVERRFAGHGSDVRLLEFHPGGRLLASVGWDGLLVVDDVLAGEELLRGEAWVRALRFSSVGDKIAFSTSHTEVGIGHFARVNCLQEWGEDVMTQGIGCRLAVSADGRWLASADFGELRIWSTTSPVALATLRATPVTSRVGELPWANIAFSPKGNELIESRRFQGVVAHRFSTAADGEAPALQVRSTTTLAEGEDAGDWVGRDEGTGDCWLVRFATGDLIRWPAGDPLQAHRVLHQEGLDGAALHPARRQIAVRRFPQPGARVIDSRDGSTLVDLVSGLTTTAEYSPDGRYLVTGSDHEYIAWSTGSWQRTASWPARTEGGSYGGVRFSPDGSQVAALIGRQVLQIRNTRNWTVQIELELPTGAWINDHQWAPDGDSLWVLGLGHRVWRWNLSAVQDELKKRGLAW